MSSNVIFFVQIPFFSPFVQDVHFVHQVLPIPLVEFVVPLSKIYLNHHHLFLLPTNVGLRWLVQCSKVNSLHKVLLNHHSMPQFLVMMIQLGPLPSKKSIRSTSNPHPIYNFLSYHRLSPPYCSFISFVSFITIPKNVNEALDHSR